jgi:hypothetical protein
MLIYIPLTEGKTPLENSVVSCLSVALQQLEIGMKIETDYAQGADGFSSSHKV